MKMLYFRNLMTFLTKIEGSSSLRRQECGGMLTAPSATIMSPNYPGLYPHGRRCEWQIRVQSDRSVTLHFSDMDIETASGCYYDYVELKNGILAESPSIGRYCGTTAPEPISSSGNTMSITFMTDGSESGRGFSAYYTSENPAQCGGVLSSSLGSSGTITSPGYHSNETQYTVNDQCIWVLGNLALANSSISLSFSDFSLEHHENCQWDFVEIREGNDENGVLVGRFCGNTLPPRFASPSNNIWVAFISDEVVTDRGFSLQYSFTGCGGILADGSGVVSSPNYPANYDHNNTCAWKIMGPEGYRIRINFTDFHIEQHPDCNYDYLEIFNGGNPTSPSIGRFCGTNVPADFRSMSHEVRVEFHTDNTLSEHGFQFTYTIEAEGCGGLIHGTEGQVTSPNWPAQYPNNAECVWEIVTNIGYHLEMNFVPPFDLEIRPDCANDFVEILDFKQDGSLVSAGKFCGNQFPSNTTKSATRRAQVKFRSNANIQGNGFAIQYSSVCGSTFEGEEGIVVSPNFPANYDNNHRCGYLIKADPQKYTVLEFNEFDIEGWLVSIWWCNYINQYYPSWAACHVQAGNDYGFACPYDWVEVFAGSDNTAPSLGRFCGNTAPQPLSALGPMYIEFVTDYIVTEKGWRARYRTSECGGVFTDPQGQIKTPTHPVNYHHNANCTWSITVADNRAVLLKFNQFEVEAHERCMYDYVEVYDGTTTSDPLIGRYCGNEAPAPIKTKSNTMLVLFVTDDSVNAEGFVASYETTLGELQGCGGTIEASSGMIGTRDYSGNGKYEKDLECRWVLLVPNDKVVKLHFESFHLEQDYDCAYDWLELRDGMYNDDDLVGRYCGSSVPADFIATSNVLNIYFRSDGSIEEAGFNATFTAEPALCGGVRTATSTPAVIRSPNYPSNYPHNVRCRWTVDAPEGEHVYFTVNDLEIEGSSDCQYDYIEFRDTPLGDIGQSVHYCGVNPTVHPFTSVGQTAQINFVTDDSSSGKGFELNYQIASCNRTYDLDHGLITSPLWPNKYPSYAHCEMLITAPAGNSLTLYFNAFYIEYHPNCNYDYLSIHNGSDSSAPLIATLCGSSLPDPISVPGNQLWMTFITDNSVHRDGFDISYTSSPEGCGGNLTGTYGTLTSPGYPGNNPQTQVCKWLVTVPPRRRPHIEWADFQIEDNNCDNNYVELYDGPSEASPKVGTYCGAGLPAQFTASTRQFLVKFSSGTDNQGTGFKLNYQST